MSSAKNVTGNRIRQFTEHRYFLIILLWLGLTAINLNKAFHIDDTFHIEAAEWIGSNPATPMSGYINWKNVPTPMYSHNQPPLFFFLIALSASIFGVSEIPLHLLLSIFTFLALIGFFKLTEILSIRPRKTLLLLFAFSPALIVNQNLMTDVPLLAIVLFSAYFLLRAGQTEKLRNYFLAALLLGMGLMIKYSVLPLFVVLGVVIIFRRDYRHLTVLIIPLVILALWSWWNYHEYGSIHFLDRPKGEFHINRFWAFVACTGSMSAFSVSLIYANFRSKTAKTIYVLLFAGFSVLAILSLNGLIPDELNSILLNIIFIMNGFIVFYALVRLLIKHIKAQGLRKYVSDASFVVFLFMASLSAFMILFAPFIATRHILLILPFILLFGQYCFDSIKAGINRISIVLTLLLGSLLGISDYNYAGYYRKMAAEIKLPEGKTVWTAGHWGWQWYSNENGMLQYATDQSPVKPGDYFVYPGNISKQETGTNLKLSLVEKKWKEAGLLTFFSGNNMASMYSNSVRIAPWTFSRSPVDTIFIFRVDEVMSIPEADNINGK